MSAAPSVEGDRLEEIARLVDPQAFEALAFSLENVERTMKPEHWEECKATVRSRFDAMIAPVYERARQIAALPRKGGEDHIADAGKMTSPTTEADIHAAFEEARKRASDKIAARIAKSTIPPVYLVGSEATTEPDTGRGLREALEALVVTFAMNNAEPVELRDALRWPITQAAAALAALSDTGNGGVEANPTA